MKYTMMIKKIKSTHDEFMEKLTPQQKREYDDGYRDLLVSELILAVLQNDSAAAYELAEAIQKLGYYDKI